VTDMNIAESLSQAMESLRSNKLRSILTMLGIVMGVFSVVAILAIGNATEAYINAQFEKIGANLITITYKNVTVDRSEWLLLDDMEIIKNAVPEMKNIAAINQKNGVLQVDEERKMAIVNGVTAQYKNFAPIEMAAGRFINEFDVASASKVIVVGENFAMRYFNRVDIVGEVIDLKSYSGSKIKVKVIGVMAGGDDLFNSAINVENFPVYVYMPITTVQNFYSNDKMLPAIMVSVTEKDNLREIGDRIVRFLELNKGKRGIYVARNSVEEQQIFSSVIGVISSVLLVIAVITLLVGGIGIVNILLVSVNERIREIGIRKALGAQKRDIVFQFLTESMIMTGFSGIVGILLGILAGNIIASQVNIPPYIDYVTVILTFLGSLLLGIIFGVYPAKKAADLDPIESLRYE